MSSRPTPPAAGMEYAKIVGLVVRSHRVLKGIDLSVMAKALGLSGPGWSRVETGDTLLNMAHLHAASKFLGIDPNVIVRHADAIAQDHIIDDKDAVLRLVRACSRSHMGAPEGRPWCDECGAFWDGAQWQFAWPKESR